MVVNAVMSTGRRRMEHAATIASRRSMPSRRSRFMQSMSTMPLFTITPTSSTNPIMETMLTSNPVMTSASNPPVKASGMVIITMKGERSD